MSLSFENGYKEEGEMSQPPDCTLSHCCCYLDGDEVGSERVCGLLVLHLGNLKPKLARDVLGLLRALGAVERDDGCKEFLVADLGLWWW